MEELLEMQRKLPSEALIDYMMQHAIHKKAEAEIDVYYERFQISYTDKRNFVFEVSLKPSFEPD